MGGYGSLVGTSRSVAGRTVRATLTAQAEETAAEFSQKRERLQTDFDNFKARHYNQTRDAQIDAKIKLVNDFLPVLDNFDRARTSISPDGATQEATNAEYQEVHARLMATLGELGMEKIEAVGTEFDYNLHMAIQQQPSDEYDAAHVEPLEQQLERLEY